MNNIFGILALFTLCFLLLVNKKTITLAGQISAADSKQIEFGRENETNGIEWVSLHLNILITHKIIFSSKQMFLLLSIAFFRKKATVNVNKRATVLAH